MKRNGMIGGLMALAALASIALLVQPVAAEARGGGGFHGGGFHGGGMGGGFHGGGFHGGGFRDGGHFAGGFRGRGGWGWGVGIGVATAPLLYGWGDYPSYGDDAVPAPYAGSGYYCQSPAGYYPYVTQCLSGWQVAPGG